LCDSVEVGDELGESCGRGTDYGHVVGVEKNLDELVELVSAMMLNVELAIDGVAQDDSFVDVAEGLVDDVI